MKFDEFQDLKIGDRVRVKAGYAGTRLLAGEWWTVERRDGITAVTLVLDNYHNILTLSRCSEWEVERK